MSQTCSIEFISGEHAGHLDLRMPTSAKSRRLWSGIMQYQDIVSVYSQ